MLFLGINVGDTNLWNISELFDHSTIIEKEIGIDIIPKDPSGKSLSHTSYLRWNCFTRYLSKKFPEIYVKGWLYM